MKMKCRVCKKKYVSDEWKNSGTLYGVCSAKCEKERQKHLKPCRLNFLVKTLNELK